MYRVLNTLAVVGLFYLLSLFSLRGYSQTCDEDRAKFIELMALQCAPSGCTTSGYTTSCVTYSNIYLQRFYSEAGQPGHRIICPYDWTYDTFYPNNPPTHEGGSLTIDLGGVWDCLPLDPRPNPPPPGGGASSGGSKGSAPGGCGLSGSLVYAEEQSLTEEVLLTGTAISLVYNSAFHDGRTADFKIYQTISGATPRDYIQSFVVETRRSGSLVDSATFANTLPNQSYTYLWDGKDVAGLNKVNSAKFNLKLKETSPSGTFVNDVEVVLGHFDAKVFGLGGWLPKPFRFYDHMAKRMYYADGGYVVVEGITNGLGHTYVSDSSGDEVYWFDSNGRHLGTKTSMLGSDLYTFTYDSSGKLSAVVQPFGKSTTFQRNLSGELVAIVAPNGEITEVVLDSNGYVSSLKNPQNEMFQMSYFGVTGLLESFQKPNSEMNMFEYNADGLLIKDSHSGGYFFELVRELNSSYSFDILMTSSLGRQSQIQASTGGGNFSRYVTSPSGAVTGVSYTPGSGSYTRNDMLYGITRSVNSIDDQRFGSMVKFPQSETHSFYGGSSRSISRTQNITLSDPNDPFSISSWQTVTQLSGENTTTTLNYDPLNKKFTSSTYLGKTSEWTIDSYERMVSSQQGTLEPIAMGYTNEHLTSVTQGSRSTSFAYNTLGLLQSVTNPLSQTTSYVYDSANRVASKVLPDSRVVGFAYDGVGNITGITPPGRPVHGFALNGHGLVGAYEPPTLSGVSVVNTTYTYNLDKQLTSVVRPDGGFINYNFNATTGVLENYETPEGFYYQSMDTVVGLPSYIETPAGVATQVGYMGRSPASYANTVSGISAGGYTPTFGTANRLESDTVTGPTGTTSTISYLYNDDEDLRKAGDVNLTYNVPNGQLTGTSMGSGTSAFTDSYAYNTYGEVTGYQAKRGTTVIYDLVLSRDGMGRIDGKTQIMNAVTDDYDYTFDSTGRLTQVQKNSVVAANYSYDSNSNRTGGNVGAQPTAATYDDQDRLLTYNTYSFNYNANGDLQSKTNSVTSTTTQYSYDVFGNLRQVVLPAGTVITYEVDALNRRIGKRVNGTLQKRWIYMDQYRIVAETNAAGTITKRFIYGSKANIPDYMIASGVKYRVISDHLGSPRLVVKQSDGAVIQRMDHDEFGRVIADTNPGYLPFGFAGGLYDHQTSLVRFGARDYDPEVGRWTSKDPILFGGGDTNLFGYVATNPVNGIDPTGLYEVCTRPLNGFEGEHGPLFHQYLCANGICGGQSPSGNPFSSPGQDSNDPAPGSTGVSCKEGPKDNKSCMDKCIASAIGGSRPNYSVINIGGANCQKWANDTVSQCAAQCGGK